MLHDILKRRPVIPAVVEYAVKDLLDTLRVTFLHKVRKICIVTQTAVQFFVISCFIAVSDRFKERSDIDRIASDLFDVTDPGKGLVQTVYRCCIGVFLGCIAKS